MDIAVLGIDLGKAVCSLAGVDGTGAVVMCKSVQRFRLLEPLARLQPCVGAMKPAAAPSRMLAWQATFADDTPVAMLVPGTGKPQTARLRA